MKSHDELLSEGDVWAEISKATEELYDVYLDLNELNLATLTQDRNGSPDMKRDWDVPTGIQVNGESRHADLVSTPR